MLCVKMDKLYELQGNLNETQMARKLEVSRSQLWRIKTNHSAVGPEFITKFKKAYPEVSITDIFFVSDVPLNQHKSTKRTDDERTKIRKGGGEAYEKEM